MKIVAIIQARMGSTRLPGKVLTDLGGETVLARVVRRVQRSKSLIATVVATTTLPEDDVIASESHRLGVGCYRGAENDVLDRYYQAALADGADLIMRITADCPVIDPEVIDHCVDLLLGEDADYATTDVPETIARGLDVEVFTAQGLRRCWQEASAPYQREHVTPYFYEHPELFRLTYLKSELDCRQYRWTLDTPDDLRLLREIYREFQGAATFSWREIVDLMRRRPELLEWNAQVVQKQVQ